METKQNPAERKQLLHYNDSIQRLIDRLPKKLGIEHCHGPKDMYYSKTPKDEKKIDQYEKEKQRLYDQLRPAPLFSTEYLDIYVRDDRIFPGYSQHPEWDSYYLVPVWSNASRWRIWDSVKVIQKKYAKN
jgi:hypothetical protein